ncbi:hypothetical protein [Streptomyces sp. NPDC001903]|uniref:hypothetical protein n=1 Tax=Streptomyces sp. NPDC001903 TaxID=3364622 RepID=UPI003694F924
MPAPVRRWWQHPALVIALLVVIPPAGIALAWTSRWGQAKKIVATVLAGLWFLTPFLGDPPKKAEADSKPAAAASASPGASPSRAEPPALVGRSLKEAKATALAAGFGVLSHDASEGNAAQVAEDDWKVCFQGVVAAEKPGAIPTLDLGVVLTDAPCPAKDGDPIPYPKMPRVVGLAFANASRTLGPIGFRKIEPQSAFTDVTLPAAVDDWVVCFQEPEEGKEIGAPGTTSAALKLASPGTGCPGAPNTRLHPEPAPAPTHEDDDSGSTASGGSSSSGGSASGGSSSGGSSSGGTSSGGSDSGGGGGGTITPGAFCSPIGASGVSSKGVRYTCTGTPGNAHWRR